MSSVQGPMQITHTYDPHLGVAWPHLAPRPPPTDRAFRNHDARHLPLPLRPTGTDLLPIPPTQRDSRIQKASIDPEVLEWGASKKDPFEGRGLNDSSKEYGTITAVDNMDFSKIDSFDVTDLTLRLQPTSPVPDNRRFISDHLASSPPPPSNDGEKEFLTWFDSLSPQVNGNINPFHQTDEPTGAGETNGRQVEQGSASLLEPSQVSGVTTSSGKTDAPAGAAETNGGQVEQEAGPSLVAPQVSGIMEPSGKTDEMAGASEMNGGRVEQDPGTSLVPPQVSGSMNASEETDKPAAASKTNGGQMKQDPGSSLVAPQLEQHRGGQQLQAGSQSRKIELPQRPIKAQRPQKPRLPQQPQQPPQAQQPEQPEQPEQSEQEPKEKKKRGRPKNSKDKVPRKTPDRKTNAQKAAEARGEVWDKDAEPPKKRRKKTKKEVTGGEDGEISGAGGTSGDTSGGTSGEEESREQANGGVESTWTCQFCLDFLASYTPVGPIVPAIMTDPTQRVCRVCWQWENTCGQGDPVVVD